MNQSDPNRTKIGVTGAVNALLAGIPLFMNDREMKRQFGKSMFVNGLVFLVFLGGIFFGVFAATSNMASSSGFGLVVAWLLRLALMFVAAVVAPAIFMLLLGIIRPMFHSAVFKAARKKAGASASEGPDGVINEAKVIANDIRRLGRLVGFSLLLVPLNLIPVLGTLAYAGFQAVLVCHTMGWDLMGYHFELHGLNLSQQKRFCRDNRLMILGLGLVGTGLCMIPIAQFVFITTNVAGSGVLSARLDGF